MIEELLRLRFPVDYALDTAATIVPMSVQNTSFILSDKKACTKCKDCRSERESCNEETLKIEVDADETVTIVNFEEYLNQFGNKLDKYKIQRCDYLILDDKIGRASCRERV